MELVLMSCLAVNCGESGGVPLSVLRDAFAW